MLGLFFGKPMTATMDPEFIRRAQAAYMDDNRPDPDDNGMGPGRGAPRPASAMQRMSQQATTPTQRIAGMAGA
jgi:hypothetical protein